MTEKRCRGAVGFKAKKADFTSCLKFKLPVIFLVIFLSLILIASPVSAAYQNETLFVAGCEENFAPFEYVDYSGNAAGFNVEIMQAVAEEMGLNISIEPGPWSELRNGLENGSIDLLCGMLYSDERAEVVSFSKPFVMLSYGIFVRDDSDIKGPGDLKGREIIVQEGDIMDDYSLGLDSSNTIFRTKSQTEALLLLASGEHDAALLSILHGDHLIHQNEITGIRIAGHPLVTYDYCIAASSNASYLIPLINEGLAIINENGRYDEIYKKWFGVYEEKEFFSTLVNIVIFVLLPIIILLAAALIWSVSLRKKFIKTSKDLEEELEKQKKVRRALRASKDKYQVLFNSLNEGVFLCEFDPQKKVGKIIEVNDIACSRLGYTREELMEKNIRDITQMFSIDCSILLKKLVEEKKEISYYAEHIRKDGIAFPVHIKARLLEYEGDQYILQLARDITKERESLEMETDALKKIEQNLIQLATLNDEIRNPLMVITGVTDMDLENSKEIILEQVEIIDKIVNRLDQGWIESAKIREFLRKHLEIKDEEDG